MRKLLVMLMLGVSLSLLAQDKPIVIVELFTSEGCSSCPPADRLLSSIVNETYPETEVIGLSFHVDYWNYIGWKDPYSSKEFSDRQRRYAQKFFNSSIYTPQMIVNGKHQFVGSSRSEWQKAFEKESNSDLVSLNVHSIMVDDSEISLRVNSSKATTINVAIVEKDLSQSVDRGENRGRTLSHDNVVRAFQTKNVEGQENFRLSFPKEVDLAKSSLIVYAQNSRNWYVSGAKKFDLNTYQ